MRIILHWIILSVAVWVTTQLISGVTVDPIWVALIVGACLTLFNMFLRPIISILTLPINVLTLGFFSLLVNGIVFWYLGTIVRGFSVTTFSAAFIGALLVTIINWVITKLFNFGY
jgi:putative membrane protein